VIETFTGTKVIAAQMRIHNV